MVFSTYYDISRYSYSLYFQQGNPKLFETSNVTGMTFKVKPHCRVKKVLKRRSTRDRLSAGRSLTKKAAGRSFRSLSLTNTETGSDYKEEQTPKPKQLCVNGRSFRSCLLRIWYTSHKKVHPPKPKQLCFNRRCLWSCFLFIWCTSILIMLYFTKCIFFVKVY